MLRAVWFGVGSGPRLMALLMLALAVFVAALLIGTSGVSLHSALGALTGAGDEAARTVLLEALFRNPLADPYVLGVSGGAAVGALLAMLASAAVVVVQSGAVLGALVA